MNPKISFATSPDDAFGLTREYLCSIWPLESDGDALAIADAIYSNVTVLVGPDHYPHKDAVLELPAAGTYLVELGYPNGATLRSTIVVADGQQYRYSITSRRTTSNENTPTLSLAARGPRVISAALKSVGLGGRDLEIATELQPNVVPLEQLRAFAADLQSPSPHAEILERITSADLSFSRLLPDQRVHSFRTGYQRRWLVISSRGKQRVLVAYPLGWSSHDGAPFRLSMERHTKEGIAASKWSASLRLTDPVYGSLIEYLTRRDVASGRGIAQSLRGQAITALYEKDDNPFAAAGAAYLLGLGNDDVGPTREWMENLCHRFDWMPDGAIALGWLLLRSDQRGSISWRDARQFFAMACARGLPYYTVGLHLLVEALTILSMADPDDVEIQRMLVDVRMVDAACVRHEPFVTLQLPAYLGLPVAS